MGGLQGVEAPLVTSRASLRCIVGAACSTVEYVSEMSKREI